MTVIANIGAYLDLLQAHINGLWVWFEIYAGKPIAEQQWTNWYFFMISNTEKVWDDSEWTHIKEALFEFIIISGSKATPDVDLYEKLDALSNLMVTQAGERIVLPGWFTIYGIQEASQSGVLSDVKENPYIAAQYKIVYQHRYSATPRI